MVSVVVQKEIPVPAEQVWALLSDFGDISWSGMTNVVVEGEGVGMTRRIIVGEGKEAVERLDAHDPQAMTFTYSILSGNAMPINDIQGSPKVSPVDDNNCILSWTITGEEQGIAESEAGEMLSGFYTGLLGVISGAVLAR